MHSLTDVLGHRRVILSRTHVFRHIGSSSRPSGVDVYDNFPESTVWNEDCGSNPQFAKLQAVWPGLSDACCIVCQVSCFGSKCVRNVGLRVLGARPRVAMERILAKLYLYTVILNIYVVHVNIFFLSLECKAQVLSLWFIFLAQSSYFRSKLWNFWGFPIVCMCVSAVDVASNLNVTLMKANHCEGFELLAANSCTWFIVCPSYSSQSVT